MTGLVAGSTVAGKYRVKGVIGAGGMGAVYEGQHLEIGKRVAIKVIDPSQAGSAEMAARFRREARAASAVESEHIVQVFDVGHDPEVGLYMVMEFLTGEDLATRLLREPRLDLDVALAIGRQTARALAKAHDAGVVHRDLKPANLFLCARDDGSIHVKILDFGISKLSDEEPGSAPPAGEPKRESKKSSLTHAGALIGTPQYMSPEQAQGLAVDRRTDVWSLGALLYEALAGTSAYPETATFQQMIIQIVTLPPKPLGEIAPWVPASLAAAIHGALTRDIDQRIQDCATFAQRLAAVTGTAKEDSSKVVIRSDSSGSLSEREVVASTRIAPGASHAAIASTSAAVVVSPPSIPGLQQHRRLLPVLTGVAVVGVMMLAASLFLFRGRETTGASQEVRGGVGLVSPPPPAEPASVLAAPQALPSVVIPPLADPPRPASSAPPLEAKPGVGRPASSSGIRPAASTARPLQPAAPGKPADQYGATGVEKDY